jgi:transglutaminase-like putative cysteine protease
MVEEIWESAYLDGARVGFLHTTVREQGGEGRLLRASAALELTFRRHNAVLRLKSENGTDETPEGKVVGVFLRQGQAQGQNLFVVGSVEDGRLHVRVDNGRIDRRIPWSDEAVGLYRLQHLFAEKKPKPGDRFSFYRYEPVLTTMVKMQVVVKDTEEVRPPTGQSARKLLRVEMRMERIETPKVTVQLPGEVWWLDEQFEPVQRERDLEGLGTLTLVRTTRAGATAEVPVTQMADLGARGLLPLNRPIRRAYFTRSATYRISIKGDEDAATALVRDGHQEARNAKGDTFELEVHPVQPRLGRHEGPANEPGKEYMTSSHFINADDEQVRELARLAVAAETDPWQKARRIERYVKQRMRPDNAAPLMPAGEVARKLRGDCRLYAFLTAAMCRAEDIPARTAIGLIYVERGGRPQMGFHMWTEVWINGQWLGLDATLGLGRVSAGHIKVADHSWDGVQSLTPLLPVQRVLGKMRIEVVRAE